MSGVRSVAGVDGWHSVEGLTWMTFSRARVLMANKAHSGLRRCIRTRRVGVRMVRAAHEVGVRRLAVEALPQSAEGVLGPIREMPVTASGYLAQPDVRSLIAAALELGWTLWAYGAAIPADADPADADPADADPAELLSLEFTNRREQEQAHNLCQILAAAPARPLLVWSGNSDAAKEANGAEVPIGHRFAALSATDPFVIDQTVTVDFTGRVQAVDRRVAGWPGPDARQLRRHRWSAPRPGTPRR